LLGRRKPGGPCLASCNRNPALDKRNVMDGWTLCFVLKDWVGLLSGGLRGLASGGGDGLRGGAKKQTKVNKNIF